MQDLHTSREGFPSREWSNSCIQGLLWLRGDNGTELRHTMAWYGWVFCFLLGGIIGIVVSEYGTRRKWRPVHIWMVTFVTGYGIGTVIGWLLR